MSKTKKEADAFKNLDRVIKNMVRNAWFRGLIFGLIVGFLIGINT